MSLSLALIAMSVWTCIILNKWHYVFSIGVDHSSDPASNVAQYTRPLRCVEATIVHVNSTYLY